MNDNLTPFAAPRWGHDRILFDIEDQGVLVHCSVSKTAIQETSERRMHLPEHLMQQFLVMRSRVEMIALRKSRRSGRSPGLLCIWSDDLDDDPAPAAPAMAVAARR